MSKSILIVISPAASQSICGLQGANLAQKLRDAGAIRVDIAGEPVTQRTVDEIDSRYSYDNVTAWPQRSRYPFSNFNNVARSAVDNLFRPIIGASDIQDLTRTLSNPALDAYVDLSYSLQRQEPGTLYNADDNTRRTDLGLAFYLAHVALAPNKHPYDGTVIIGMPKLHRTILQHLKVNEDAKDNNVIDLHALRAAMPSMMALN